MPFHPEHPKRTPEPEPVIVFQDRPAAPAQPITYLIQQAPAAPVDQYHVPPGAHLVAGPDGRPTYAYPQAPEPAGTQVSPLLVNLALAAAALLGIGAGCWLIASLIAALAELLKAVAMVAGVILGGGVLLKVLGGGGGRSVQVQAISGKNVRVNGRKVRASGRRR